MSRSSLAQNQSAQIHLPCNTDVMLMQHPDNLEELHLLQQDYQEGGEIRVYIHSMSRHGIKK